MLYLPCRGFRLLSDTVYKTCSYIKMVDKVLETYKEVAKIADLKSGKILSVTPNEGCDDKIALQVTWSARNLSTLEKATTINNYLVQGHEVSKFSPVPVNKKITLSQRSVSGKYTAHLSTSKKNQYIMVVGEDSTTETFDLKAADEHGKVYEDSEFSCLEWSPDESKLLYVAEKKQPKACNFYAKYKGDGPDGRGQQFVVRDDWGEQLEEKHQSVVCILDVKTGQITTFDLKDELCPSQMIWGPGGLGVIGVAYISQPYRLGLIYCHIRDSVLFYLDLEGNYSEITNRGSNMRTPRLSLDEKSVVFLRSTVGGPHAKCAQLCLLSWNDKKESILVDIVKREMDIVNGYKFKGIYGYSGLSRRCWANDNKRIIFSTLKYDNIVTFVVNIETKNITELPHINSLQVLDLFDDWILGCFSNISHSSVVEIAQLLQDGEESKTQFRKVTGQRNIPGVPNHWSSTFMFLNPVPHPDPKYSDIHVSAIYFGPLSLEEGSPKRPLICWPHGGPHSTQSNVFSLTAAFFVKLGYSIVFPNYRGSLGFGEDAINSLPGYCGVVDVSDVHQATLQCLHRFSSVLDASKVALVGGSHGGFLVAHLAAQYPDFYSAVCSRNPVTDISAMANVTDIPDWTYVETGQEFKIGNVPNAAVLAKMYEMSPIYLIDAVKAPTLLLIGKNDRRVPPSQGINYHKMLLARGVDTKLYLYDDNHALSKVDVEIDLLIHSALWLDKYCK